MVYTKRVVKSRQPSPLLVLSFDVNKNINFHENNTPKKIHFSSPNCDWLFIYEILLAISNNRSDLTKKSNAKIHITTNDNTVPINAGIETDMPKK